MEIVQEIFIWVVVGVWISYKRNWYKDNIYSNQDERNICIGVNIIFAPIALVIALFDIFIKGSWKKD